jgi:homoserine O-acetyltransferase
MWWFMCSCSLFTDRRLPKVAPCSLRFNRYWCRSRRPDYSSQPSSLRFSNAFFALATNGGTLAYQKAAPTIDLADKRVEAKLAPPFTLDANDFLYQWSASRGYNPAPSLKDIKAAVLAINAADDERYPPETGLMERAMQLIPNGRLLLIPASEDTCGHGTNGLARIYKRELHELLQSTPRIEAPSS